MFKPLSNSEFLAVRMVAGIKQIRLLTYADVTECFYTILRGRGDPFTALSGGFYVRTQRHH